MSSLTKDTIRVYDSQYLLKGISSRFQRRWFRDVQSDQTLVKKTVKETNPRTQYILNTLKSQVWVRTMSKSQGQREFTKEPKYRYRDLTYT